MIFKHNAYRKISGCSRSYCCRDIEVVGFYTMYYVGLSEVLKPVSIIYNFNITLVEAVIITYIPADADSSTGGKSLVGCWCSNGNDRGRRVVGRWRMHPFIIIGGTTAPGAA